MKKINFTANRTTIDFEVKDTLDNSDIILVIMKFYLFLEKLGIDQKTIDAITNIFSSYNQENIQAKKMELLNINSFEDFKDILSKDDGFRAFLYDLFKENF